MQHHKYIPATRYRNEAPFYESFSHYETGSLNGQTPQGDGEDRTVTWESFNLEASADIVTESLSYGTHISGRNSLTRIGTTDQNCDVKFNQEVIDLINPTGVGTKTTYHGLLFKQTTINNIGRFMYSLGRKTSSSTFDTSIRYFIDDGVLGTEQARIRTSSGATSTAHTYSVLENEVYFFLLKLNVTWNGTSYNVDMNMKRYDSGNLPTIEPSAWDITMVGSGFNGNNTFSNKLDTLFLRFSNPANAGISVDELRISDDISQVIPK